MTQTKIKSDPFLKHRLSQKGVFVATKTPRSARVLAKDFDYKQLSEKLEKMGLGNESIAVRYLEPKEAICAY